jgi:hypothetical protein
MAKGSDRLRGGFDMGETGGALSGLLAEEDEFDRRALWRLGTWAAVSIGAVIVALITNQSSVGLRREQTASADLLKQAQLLQLTAKEGQNETRRLTSSVETLNSDRDRLYSRVAVLEQGLDSVTGAIARQSSAASSSPANTGQSSTSQSSASQASPSQAGASTAAPTGPSTVASTTAPSPASTTSAVPAATASVDPPPAAAKPSLAPVVAAVAATAPAALEKQDKDKQDKDKQNKQASNATASEPSLPVKLATAPQLAPAQQAAGSLVASKSMMAPPDPAAGKLIEPTAPPKAVTASPMPEVATVAPKAPGVTASDPTPAPPELVVRRTEFGVDVGGANSIPGLRALWRGLLKSHTNAALTKLRPIIVIKENSNGLGMQLRLVAGPISDAAAAAKICASLTLSDRSCSTSVFEGQRLALNSDETDKTEASKSEADSKPEPVSRYSSSSRYKHYTGNHPKTDDPPKPEPSTLSSIFGRH